MECQGCATFGCVKNIKMFDVLEEDTCWEWLKNHGLTYEGWSSFGHIKCPVCSKEMRKDEGREVFVCTGGRSCRKTLAFRMPYASGHCSARSFIIIILGVFHFSIESELVRHSAQVSISTITSTVAMIQGACAQYHKAEAEKLEELREIQVDEVQFGARKYQKGKRTNKGGVVWYLTIAAIDGSGPKKRTTKVYSQLVQDRSAATLVPLIKRKCSATTTVFSDCWRSYRSVAEFVGAHLTVNHSREFKNPKTGAHTNNVESSHSQIKRNLRKRFRILGIYAESRHERVITGTVLHNSSLEGLPPVCGIFEALRWCIWN